MEVTVDRKERCHNDNSKKHKSQHRKAKQLTQEEALSQVYTSKNNT
jgi:hypothetical protein